MICKCFKSVVFFILSLFLSQSLQAKPDLESTEAGMLSEAIRIATLKYEKEDYSSAKVYFEIALERALQQDEPANSIYYNLGSVCYRLGQYDQSRAYFNKLIDHDSLKALAYYNLGLIENRLSKKKSAIDYFYKSKHSTSDEDFIKLIDRQLQKISKKKPQRNSRVKRKDWHAYLYLGPGYDSNIRFAPLEVASNESGDFIQGFGIFDKRIAGEGYGIKRSAILFTASAYLTNYFSTDFNDYSIYDIGLRYLAPVNKWRNALDLKIQRSAYGHRDYQRTLAATIRSKRKFSDGDVLRLRFRYDQIDSLDTLFDYLEGDRQRLRAGYQFRWPMDSTYLWYELEFNDRKNTLSRNYSPTRNSFRLRYEKRFDLRNRAYAEIAYRYSEYDPTPSQDRRDNRTDYILAYVNELASDWQLQARWGFRTNRSSESIFSYDRHIVLLTLRLTL